MLALDSDFLCTGASGLRHSRAFASRRRIEGDRARVNRLYAVESAATNTGTRADHRLSLRASQIESFTRALAAQLGVAGVTGTVPEGAAAWMAPLVKDLQAHRGDSVVIAGDGQPPIVHALAHAINEALGNVGSTVTYTQTAEAQPTNQLAGLRELVGEMYAGTVEYLLILGGNPVYTAPSDLNFAAALQRVPARAHLSLYEDETSAPVSGTFLRRISSSGERRPHRRRNRDDYSAADCAARQRQVCS
jgi:molybdopterin-containing oxidoreductase family iron-sulfur binding subunit